MDEKGEVNPDQINVECLVCAGSGRLLQDVCPLCGDMFSCLKLAFTDLSGAVITVKDQIDGKTTIAELKQMLEADEIEQGRVVHVDLVYGCEQLSGISRIADLALPPLATMQVLFREPGVEYHNQLLNDACPSVRFAAAIGLMSSSLGADSSHRLRAIEVLGKLGDIGVPHVVTALSSDDARVRQSAVSILVGMGAPGAKHTASLAALLRDPDRGVRQLVRKSLRMVAMPQTEDLDIPPCSLGSDIFACTRFVANVCASTATPDIAIGLEDIDDQIRKDSASALSKFGVLAAPYCAQLAALLNDPSASVRRHAAIALGNVGPVAAQFVPNLAQLLSEPCQTSQSVALEALGKIGALSAPCGRQVAAFLHDPNPSIRRQACVTLKKFGTLAAPYASELANLVEDPDNRVRAQAVAALGKLGKLAAAYLPNLMTIIADPDVYVRREVVEALGKIGPPAALPCATALADKILDCDYVVRRNAASSLMHLGPPTSSLGAFATLIGDADPDMRKLAAEAIGKAGSVAAAPFAEQLSSLLADPCSEVRHVAAETLGIIGKRARAFTSGLLDMVSVSDSVSRCKAVEALAKIGVPTARPIVVPMLADSQSCVRAAAAKSLSRLGPLSPACVTDLAALLNDTDHLVRQNAAECLGKIGQPAHPHINRLAAALTDSDYDVRCHVVEALGRLGAASLPHVAALEALRTDSDSIIRARVLKALEKIHGVVGAASMNDGESVQ